MEENLIAAGAPPRTPPSSVPQILQVMGRGLAAPALDLSGLAPNPKWEACPNPSA